MDTTTREDLIRSHDGLSADPSFQTGLPVSQPPELPRTGPSVLGDVFEAIGGFIAFIAPVLRLLLIFALIVLVIFVLYSLARALYDRRERLGRLLNRPNAADDLKTVDLRPEEQFARTLLSDADALAAAGRYGEAIRLLLLSSIRDMQVRIHQRIGVSLTAREIGRLGALPDVSRLALHRIIHTVELNVFGEQPVGQDDYSRAREDYTLLAFEGGKA
jgi:hypothetical protein